MKTPTGLAQRIMQGRSKHKGKRPEVRLQRLLTISRRGCQSCYRSCSSRNCAIKVKRKREVQRFLANSFSASIRKLLKALKLGSDMVSMAPEED